jgi:arsenate reductase
MTLPASDDEILLLHNPRCSKSRSALDLLEQAGAAFTERRYLEDPLDLEELRDLRARLDLPAREWLRSSEKTAQEAGLSPELDEDEILAAMQRDPILMQRPILVRGRRAVIGRPPERLNDLLD